MSNRIHVLYLNAPDPYIPPGLGPPRQISSPTPISFLMTEQRRNRQVPIARASSSIASDSGSDNLSCVSSELTGLSTVGSRWAPMDPIDYGYDFPCEFGVLGCELTFHPSQIDAWISHSFSHFGKKCLPTRTCCPFCDSEVFENSRDPSSSWRERMFHIADYHLRDPAQHTRIRPDFFVIEHMRTVNLLSDEDYKWAIQFTERPKCDGLVNFGHKTPEMRRKEEKGREQRHDLVKEDRQRRRERDRGKGRGRY